MDQIRQKFKDIRNKTQGKAVEGPLNVMKGLLGGELSFYTRVDQTNQKDGGFLDEHKISITTKNGPVTFMLSEIEAFTVEDLAKIDISSGVLHISDDIRKYTKNKFKPERPILTYQYKDGKIQCFEHTSGSSGKRPYAVLRDHYNLWSGHYWAIED